MKMVKKTKKFTTKENFTPYLLISLKLKLPEKLGMKSLTVDINVKTAKVNLCQIP